MEKKVVLHNVKHSPSSIFTKEDVVKLIKEIDVEPTFISFPFDELDLEFIDSFLADFDEEIKPQTPKQNKSYMISLYDYLGRAAGKQLGGEVCATARALKETIEERPISNPKFTGNVHLYRREFLDEYFGNKIYEGEQK